MLLVRRAMKGGMFLKNQQLQINAEVSIKIFQIKFFHGIMLADIIPAPSEASAHELTICGAYGIMSLSYREETGMEEYYKKIKKGSAKSTLFSMVFIIMGAFLLYYFGIGGGASDTKNRYFGVLLGAAMLLVGIWAIFSGMRGIKRVKGQVAQAGVDGYLISQDLDQGTSYKECSVGKHYAIQYQYYPDIIFLDNALIVYMDVQSTSHYVRVVENDGNSKYLSADDADEMKAIFAEITRERPYVLTKMDNATRELQKKNISEIIRIVNERKDQYESGNVEGN